MDLILTGRRIGAAEALAMGSSRASVPAASLHGRGARLRARARARRRRSRCTTRCRRFAHGLELPLAQGLELEATLFGLVAATDDMKEGTRAFLEKRKPVLRGV